MELKKTHRGFEYIEFRDGNGDLCTIQQSSAIDNTEQGYDSPGSSYLWVGLESADHKVMASKAESLGVATTETTGWVPFPIPDDVSLNTRMHLHRDQIAELIPVLQRWLDTGSLTT
jgi:hypothetical protein